MKGSYWTPYEIGGEVGSDMAVIWCHRRCQREWVGTGAQPPRDIHYQGQEFMSRSTLVFHKEDGTWRVLHAHFSEGDKGPRAGRDLTTSSAGGAPHQWRASRRRKSATGGLPIQRADDGS